MTLDEINAEWAADAPINREQLDIDSLDIPKLHSKYVKMLSKERLVFKALDEKKKQFIQKLTDYFGGSLDGKEIGRPAWQLNETKSAIEKRVENDAELSKMKIQIYQAEEKVQVLIEIIKNINQRNFQIKNAIDFMRFMNGS